MPYRYIPPAQKELIARMLISMTPKDISQATGISVRSVQRTVALWRREGIVSHVPLSTERPCMLKPWHLAYIEGLIERQADLYLSEIQQELYETFEIHCSEQTIMRAMQRRGFVRKKVSRIAQERDADWRSLYLEELAHCPPETYVYLDESACNRHTTQREYAWAPVGSRARRHDFFIQGIRYSILPAISLDGVLHLDIITRAWNGSDFRTYLDTLLNIMNPYPQKNSVLIMDNLSAHHYEGIREMVEARGCRLLYLPPYSPDFNPIEEGFSAMKAWIKAHNSYLLAEMTGVDGNPMGLLWEAVYQTMNPEAIQGWYQDCHCIPHM